MDQSLAAAGNCDVITPKYALHIEHFHRISIADKVAIFNFFKVPIPPILDLGNSCSFEFLFTSCHILDAKEYYRTQSLQGFIFCENILLVSKNEIILLLQ